MKLCWVSQHVAFRKTMIGAFSALFCVFSIARAAEVPHPVTLYAIFEKEKHYDRVPVLTEGDAFASFGSAENPIEIPFTATMCSSKSAEEAILKFQAHSMLYATWHIAAWECDNRPGKHFT